MKYFLRYILALFVFSTILGAVGARPGLITFTQPDGTQFEGYSKGDATFHWIESNSKIVMNNKKDGFFYNAKINVQGKLVLTNEKPMTKTNSHKMQAGLSMSEKKKSHSLDKTTADALRAVQKQARKGNHPK